MNAESFSARLKRFDQIYGRQTFADFYQTFFKEGRVPSAAFTKVLLQLIRRNFPTADFGKLERDLKKPQYIFTANHGGFENHPQLTAGSLLTTAGAHLAGREAIFLTCAALTPKHTTMPAGFMLHALRPDLKRSQLRFLSNKYNEVFIDRCPWPEARTARERLHALPPEALLPHERQVIADLKLNRDAPSFADALLQHNAQTYEKALGRWAPGIRCYFADIDKLASLLLIEDLQNHGPFYDLISDSRLLAELIVAMTGCVQAWSPLQIAFNEEPGTYTAGTVLFFGINQKNEHSRLGCRIDRRDGHTQITLLNHKGFSMVLTPDNLLQALQEGRVHPNTFTVNMLLTLFHNCALAGGIFFDGYIGSLIGIPARLLSMEVPEAMLQRRVQSVMLPVRCRNLRAPDTFDEARPLLHIDLLAKGEFSTEEVETILSADLHSALPLSLTEVLFGVELTPEEAARRRPELMDLLRADSPLTLSFE